MQKHLEKLLAEANQIIMGKNWQDKRMYGNFLAQTFYFVQHSTRLLALAASRLPMERSSSFLQFISHLGEEKNHDKIALTDLKKLGFTLDDFPELPSTRAFYESQYYKIEHLNPTSLLGYILFLEALAVHTGPILYAAAKKSHGLSCTQFLKIHIEEDPHHVDRVLVTIEALPNGEKQVIETNLIQSAKIYSFMIECMAETNAA